MKYEGMNNPAFYEKDDIVMTPNGWLVVAETPGPSGSLALREPTMDEQAWIDRGLNSSEAPFVTLYRVVKEVR